VIEPVPTSPSLDQLLAGITVRLHAKWTPRRGDVVSFRAPAGDRRLVCPAPDEMVAAVLQRLALLVGDPRDAPPSARRRATRE